MSGILTVFFFAKLWRRSGVLTDVEFIELRYSGPPAAALRLARALFQGVFVNTIIMGWVNLAMAKILELTLHVPKLEALGRVSRVHGDLRDDRRTVGRARHRPAAVRRQDDDGDRARGRSRCSGRRHRGLENQSSPITRRRHKVAIHGSILAFFPTTNEAWLPLLTFVTYIGVQWWASSYPGAEPGGGGYIAQRIFSAKSENDSLAGDAVLQRRALRAAALAVDPGRSVPRSSCTRTACAVPTAKSMRSSVTFKR